MSATILELSNGHCSLEFAESYLPSVMMGIQKLWGESITGPYVASQSVRFGGCDFVFQIEWDDPCLIACSDEGSLMLRRLAVLLSGDLI